MRRITLLVLPWLTSCSYLERSTKAIETNSEFVQTTIQSIDRNTDAVEHTAQLLEQSSRLLVDHLELLNQSTTLVESNKQALGALLQEMQTLRTHPLLFVLGGTLALLPLLYFAIGRRANPRGQQPTPGEPPNPPHP